MASAVMGNPINSVAWLANKLHEFGVPRSRPRDPVGIVHQGHPLRGRATPSWPCSTASAKSRFVAEVVTARRCSRICNATKYAAAAPRIARPHAGPKWARASMGPRSNGTAEQGRPARRGRVSARRAPLRERTQRGLFQDEYHVQRRRAAEVVGWRPAAANACVAGRVSDPLPPVSGRRAPGPPPERAVESAGLGVAEQERRLVDGDPLPDVALGQLRRSSCSRARKRRPFLAQPPVQGALAEAEAPSDRRRRRLAAARAPRRARPARGRSTVSIGGRRAITSRTRRSSTSRAPAPRDAREDRGRARCSTRVLRAGRSAGGAKEAAVLGVSAGAVESELDGDGIQVRPSRLHARGPGERPEQELRHRTRQVIGFGGVAWSAATWRPAVSIPRVSTSSMNRWYWASRRSPLPSVRLLRNT